jgi:hypothetical protein
MSTWLNRGASGGPCGELTEKDQTPSRSDSHQPASTKAGVVHNAHARCRVSSSRADHRPSRLRFIDTVEQRFEWRGDARDVAARISLESSTHHASAITDTQRVWCGARRAHSYLETSRERSAAAAHAR